MGGGDREPAAQRPAQPLGGGPHGEDRGARPHHTLCRPGLHPGWLASQAVHLGGLEDLDPLLHETVAEAERQAGGLDRRRVGEEDAAAEERRRAAFGNLLGAQLDGGVGLAELAAGGDRLDGGLVMRCRGRDLQVAGVPEPGVHPLALAELADPGDGGLGGAGDGERRLRPPAPAHARQREPHHVAEAAVAAARPVPAAAGLEQDDARLRLERLDVPRRPHPRVAAADHDEVGLALTGQRLCRLDRAGLLQPVAVRRVLHRRSPIEAPMKRGTPSYAA